MSRLSPLFFWQIPGETLGDTAVIFQLPKKSWDRGKGWCPSRHGRRPFCLISPRRYFTCGSHPDENQCDLGKPSRQKIYIPSTPLAPTKQCTPLPRQPTPCFRFPRFHNSASIFKAPATYAAIKTRRRSRHEPASRTGGPVGKRRNKGRGRGRPGEKQRVGRQFREAVALGPDLTGRRVAPTCSHVDGEFQPEGRSRSQGLTITTQGTCQERQVITSGRSLG